MLLKITNRCTEGCRHCLSDCKPEGTDMSVSKLCEIMDWIMRENFLPSAVPIIITGGEPLNHPDILGILSHMENVLNSDRWKSKHYIPTPIIIASNGFPLYERDRETVDEILSICNRNKWSIQVSADSRYYPRELNRTKRVLRDPAVVICNNCVEMITSQGRARSNSIPSPRTASSCINVLSVRKQLKGLTGSGTLFRSMSLLADSSKFCCPSIEPDGALVAGESSCCPHIVDDVTRYTLQDIERKLDGFQCHDCDDVNCHVPPAVRDTLGWW